MTDPGSMRRSWLALCVSGSAVAGNAVAGGTPGRAFRVTSLELRDPHAFVLVLGVVCRDTTATVNNEIAAMITSDEDEDGYADLNLVFAFEPLDPVASCGPVATGEGLCTMPLAETTCSRDAQQLVDLLVQVNEATGTCLAALPGTTRPYVPAVTPSAAPCFVTEPFPLRWAPFPAPIVMEHAEIAATYSGTPPDALINGLVRGFVSEAQADAVLFPDDFPVVGGEPVSVVLAGGSGNCAGHDDRDLGPDGLTRGWWLYWNFTAEPAPFTCDHPADLDTSCGVDLGDFRTLASCVAGNGDANANCLCHLADLHTDLYVDLRDYATFQTCFSGGTATIPVGCAGP